jgi:FkbM family methyltransferase
MGLVMRIYRRSPFVSFRAGAFLARALHLVIRFRRQKVVIKQINGITYELDLRQVIDASLFFSSSFEPEVEDFFIQNVSVGATVVDIGANTGYHALHLAKLVGEFGKVIAIEPTSWALSRLAKNLSLNPDLASRIEVLPCALDNPVDGITISNNAYQSSYQLNGQFTDVEEAVTIQTLDRALSGLNKDRISLIKIDTDGHEVGILEGGKQTIARDRPLLIVEFTPRRIFESGQDLRGIIEWLVMLSYQVLDLDGSVLLNPIEHLEALRNESTMLVFRPTLPNDEHMAVNN